MMLDFLGQARRRQGDQPGVQGRRRRPEEPHARPRRHRVDVAGRRRGRSRRLIGRLPERARRTVDSRHDRRLAARAMTAQLRGHRSRPTSTCRRRRRHRAEERFIAAYGALLARRPRARLVEADRRLRERHGRAVRGHRRKDVDPDERSACRRVARRLCGAADVRRCGRESAAGHVPRARRSRRTARACHAADRVVSDRPGSLSARLPERPRPRRCDDHARATTCSRPENVTRSRCAGRSTRT